MRGSRAQIVAGLTIAASALLVGASVTPASAAVPSSGLTFFSGGFTGTTVTYPSPSTGCTVLPFTAHAELNLTSVGITVYRTADCSGAGLFFPADDLHSFVGFDGVSFRATS